MWHIYQYNSRTGSFLPVYDHNNREVAFARRDDAEDAGMALQSRGERVNIIFQTPYKPRPKVRPFPVIRTAPAR